MRTARVRLAPRVRIVASLPLLFSRLALVPVVVALAAATVSALPYVPAIPKGDIALRLKTIAAGVAAPDYGISPPGDLDRLFVVEQNGLLRIVENDVLLPGAALNIQHLVQQAPVGNGPLNAGSASCSSRSGR
jgi:hypothetical protein